MNNSIYIPKILLLVALLVAVTACSANATTIATNTTSSPVETYPILSTQDTSSLYPGRFQVNYKDKSELQPPSDTLKPERGKASISGLIYIPLKKSILPDMLIYLAPAEGENKDQLPSILIGSGIQTRGDVIGRTDEAGRFYLNNIPPGNYFLIISYPNNMIPASKGEGDPTPLLIQLSADQRLPMGLVVCPSD